MKCVDFNNLAFLLAFLLLQGASVQDAAASFKVSYSLTIPKSIHFSAWLTPKRKPSLNRPAGSKSLYLVAPTLHPQQQQQPLNSLHPKIPSVQNFDAQESFSRNEPVEVPEMTQLTLEERWKLEQKEPHRGLQTTTLDILKERHVLFVAGFMNEISLFNRTYYQVNNDVVKNELGATTSFMWPSSFNSPSDNSDQLRNRILELYELVRKPLVLVGHSKGGAEVLYTLLKYPELILNGVVDRAVLIQAAIGGSPIVVEESRDLTFQGLRWVLGKGLSSLKRETAHQEFTQTLNQFKAHLKSLYPELTKSELCDVYQQISNRIFYVRSFAHPNQLNNCLQFVQNAFKVNIDALGKNDGILLVEDQINEEIGVDLGVVNSNHLELTTPQPKTELDIKAFTRALFQQIYEPTRTSKCFLQSAPVES
jgi:hypothetical protein